MILFLTNKIYAKKQAVLAGEGWKTSGQILALIFFEIGLAIVSLPLYLRVKPVGLSAFFKDENEFKTISADYNLRRILTLTGVGAFFVIWLVKLILILALPRIYGSLQLYGVVNLRPADVMSTEAIIAETGMQTARIVNSISYPTLKKVSKGTGGSYVFSGVSAPGSTVVLMLSGTQTAIYYSTADKKGAWEITHDGKQFHLSDGNHAVLTFNYNSNGDVRSPTAPEQYFKVTSSVWESVAANVDSIANWSLLIIVLMGVFLTLLTI